MKNIVIFSDGTCSESDDTYVTNVLKLYKMIERRTEKQVAFYDPGVGTNWLKITGSAFGVGISKNIQECYSFIVDYYEPGDKIYLFGFSRGAYTVRSLGGMINKVGILKRKFRDIDNIDDKVYDIYKRKNNDKDAEDFNSNFCWTKTDNEGHINDIHFIGVWDTVSALGFPLSKVNSLNPFSYRWYGFHNKTLSPHVKYAYQALSIDDQRKIFGPEIWNETNEVQGQTIEQVWFTGVHSNIGGGYRRSGLSDITLQWMSKKAKEAGLILWDNHHKKVLITPESGGKIYDSCSGFGQIYIKKLRDIAIDSRIHTSVFERIDNDELNYNPKNIPNSFQKWDDDGLVKD
ncbi:MAG: DUF2235 domain-containing protein [Campylobacterota bacterium]|nr:DUF2235 domain-containing protein [Campylobacterota bacterium]